MTRPARRNRPAPAVCGAAVLLTAVLLTAVLPTGPAEGQTSAAAVEAALAEARHQLAASEPQIAESAYRDALREAWHLIGLLAVAAGDLPAARDALERSTVSAAVGVLAPRLDLALVQYHLGETADALQRLRALTREFRSQPVVWEKLAATLAAEGRWEEWREQLEDLRLVLPAAAEELEERFAELEDAAPDRRAAEPPIDLGRLQHGVEDGALAAALDLAVARAHFGLGTLHARAGRVPRAVDDYSRALATGVEIDRLLAPAETDPAGAAPSATALREALAASPRGDGERRAALTTFAQARAPEAADVGPLAALLSSALPPLEPAARMIARGDLRAAEGLLRRAQKQGHDSPAVAELLSLVRAGLGDGVRARLELARAAARKGAPKAALELLAVARRHAPSSEEVLATYARVAMSVGLTEPAVQALEPLAGIFPRVAEYAHLLGLARIRQGATTEAVEALQRSVELAPRWPSYRFALAQALNGEKRFDEAESHLLHLLEETPQDLAAAAALARAEEGLDKLESAERRALSVLARAPEHAAAQLVIGMVRMKQERYAEAREALEAALAADPDAAKAHYQLSLACMRLGDRESARRHLDLYRVALAGAEGKTTELKLEPGARPAGEGDSR